MLEGTTEIYGHVVVAETIDEDVGNQGEMCRETGPRMEFWKL